ncbi:MULTISPECIES: hypothetical protein [unclassified Nocardioides]|nr:hypothetical protein [Nocardioides sp. Arc9.136]WKN48343.1 hypothetical protein OSR43_20240 [Nocardioides sp. Arc9.136]
MLIVRNLGLGLLVTALTVLSFGHAAPEQGATVTTTCASDDCR